MPTTAQIRELIDNTTSEWTEQDDVNGRLFTSKNGNSIFIPATGLAWDGSIANSGRNGYVWSSMLDTSSIIYGQGRYFDSGIALLRTYLCDRCGGLPVRGVIGSIS